MKKTANQKAQIRIKEYAIESLQNALREIGNLRTLDRKNDTLGDYQIQIKTLIEKISK